MICYHTKFQDPIYSSINIIPNSEVGTATMLVLLMAENWEVQRLGGL
jgi:hypothetical protein